MMISNFEIAKIFEQIAAILEIQGANRFRIRAYQQAAAMIAGLPRELADLYVEGGKQAIDVLPGIGADLSAKIEELITTGKLAHLRELQKKIPAAVLAMMEIEGMGPKRTKFVFEKFGVKSIRALERLLASGRMEQLPGWGEKSVANIQSGVQQLRAFGSRRPLAEALPLAESMVGRLRATGFAKQIEIAGSLRRRKETIGDIDLLATSTQPVKLIEAFVNLPEIKNVIARGTTKCLVMLRNGLDCDLRVLEPEAFGAGMYYFTGSKEHNVAMRTLAVKKGLTVSEYGVFQGTKEKKGRRVAGRSEEEIFQTLGMEYIEPELRENAGEIEAALRHALPKLITEKDLKGDLQMHSLWSDGTERIADMARAAKKYGHEYVAMTDHASPAGMLKGIKEHNYKKYISEIRAAEKSVRGIRILAGVEVDMQKDGGLYLFDRVLGAFDFVLAAVHGAFKIERGLMTKRIIRALEHPCVHALAHPATRILQRRAPIDADWEAVMKTATRCGKALELNASPLRLDLDDVHCRMAKAYGVRIMIGSDAHGSGEMDLSYGIMTARRGWLEKEDVINTMGFAQLQKWLKKR